MAEPGATEASRGARGGGGLTTGLFLSQACALLVSAALILVRAVYFSCLLSLQSLLLNLRELFSRATGVSQLSEPLLQDSKESSSTSLHRSSTSPKDDTHAAEPGCDAVPGAADAGFTDIELYEGTVVHARARPVSHRFSYPVRMALVNLDRLPAWFARSSAPDHLSADRVRELSQTDGPVFLLTNPASVGYEQNPISVYYCYGKASSKEAAGSCTGGLPSPEMLQTCIAEVTNTPWGDRVLFTFAPGEDAIVKPLHVSPFMDMKSDWRITARAPQQFLHLAFRVQHRELGPYFVANLSLRSCSARVLGQTQHQAQHQTQHQNQLAAGSTKNRSWSRGDEDLRGLRAQRFLWLMPHQVAFWIYWQALQLWWKGCPLFTHPKYEAGEDYRMGPIGREGKKPTSCCALINGRAVADPPAVKGQQPRLCIWTDAVEWPWQ